MTDRPKSAESISTPVEVALVLEAIDHHDAWFDVSGPEAPFLEPAALRRRITYCCEAFQACHYTALGRNLPRLIVEAHRAVKAAPVGACDVYETMSRVYQLTASFLFKYGETTKVYAALAADRALAAAQRSANPVAIGAASRRVAKSMLREKRGKAATVFASSVARNLNDDLKGLGPIGLSTLGMLHLNAAIATSGAERDRTSRTFSLANDLLDEASEVAGQQGVDLNADWTAFGPTNVTLHRVDVLVRLEDGWSALEASEALSSAALAGLAKERRAQHFITMARAQLMTRHKDDAVQALLAAEELAPEEVRRRPSSVELAKSILDLHPQPGAALRALAQRCGLLT
ncbi:DNA-binding protein [Streptomyces sp. NPDC049906]|uniref:DNA-binding protein n=1 Tax=Streptomyces sp. NPDC049906 TaxID=3155656 RepID=UPI0034435271